MKEMTVNLASAGKNLKTEVDSGRTNPRTNSLAHGTSPADP